MLANFYYNLESFDSKWFIKLKLAATDGRYVRSAGIPVLGFSPIKNHPILLHDHNERMHETSIIEGRQIYIELIKSLTEVN